MGNINISTNTSVRLGNIGNVREAAAGDQSSLSKAIGGFGKQVSSIGGQAWDLAMEMKEREDNAKVNDAMSALLIGSGKIQDGILGDSSLPPGEYQSKYQEGYDKLYGEVTKDLNSAQLEKMKAASGRVFSHSMVSLGHTAMQRTVAREKESAANLCAAAKARAVENPNDETIGFYLGAFTDAEKEMTQEIKTFEKAGKTKEAAALREALRIRQAQGVDEILGEHAMNQIRQAEAREDVDSLKQLSQKDWTTVDDAKYNKSIERLGFGAKTAAALSSAAKSAILRVKSAKAHRAKEETLKTERQMFLEKIPDDDAGIAERCQSNAKTYEELSTNEDLSEADRTSYARAAQALRESAISHLAHMKRKDRAETEQAQDKVFGAYKAIFTYGEDLKSGKKFAPHEMRDIATKLMAENKIRVDQFYSLMGIQKKKLSDEQRTFRDMCVARFNDLKSTTRLNDGRVEFVPTEKYRTIWDKTSHEVDLEHHWFNDTEEKFSNWDFIMAMNTCLIEGEKKGWIAIDMFEQFDRLTRRDQTSQQAQSIADYLWRARNAAEAR